MLNALRVALVGFADRDAATLRGLLEHEGAFCRAVSRPSADALVKTTDTFDAVVLARGGDVVADGAATNLIHRGTRPVLVVDVAIDPCSPQEIVKRLADLEVAGPAAGRTSAATVVIADDDPVASMLLEATLSREGLACHVAGDGEEALALIRQFRPTVVVLDVTMPRRDGFQVLQLLKADPATAPARVLMLTGRGEEEDVRRGAVLGTAGYVLKPFKAADVAERVKTLIAAAEASPNF
jgi:CheY-like chemotaxis protein